MMKFILLVCCLISATVNAEEITLEKNNTVVMSEEFTPEAAARVVLQASQLDSSLPPGAPIYLVLNSPGGGIFAGLEMIENLNSLSRPINTVTIFAASMGFQTVQQLKGRRLITEAGTLMSHKARGGVDGEFPGQLDSRYRYILGVVTDMDTKDAARTKGKHTLKSYQALVENEYWCSPADCAKNGFIDAVVTVKCGKSLSGTHGGIIQGGNFLGMFLETKATFADCPMITAPVSVQTSVDGQAFNKVVNKLTRDQKEVVSQFQSQALNSFLSKTRRVVFY